MALLRQSPIWPVHSVRRLHNQAQLSYLWQFYLPDDAGLLVEELMFLCQRVSIPGIDGDRIAYGIGGQENYTLGKSRRGGVVSLSVIELEGGRADKFFRNWFDEVDVPSQEVTVKSRARGPKGTGAPGEGYARQGVVNTLTRRGAISAQWDLLRLLPLRLGRLELAYEGSTMKVLPVDLVCDEVRRVE